MRANDNHTFKVSFTLDEGDAQYFRRRYRKAKSAVRAKSPDAVLRSAREIVKQACSSKKTPHFVVEAISTLEDLADLIEDKLYAAPASVRNEVLAGIAYFADPQDLIPDDVPGLGFLDDAIMIKFIGNEFRHELRGYRKFKRLLDALHQRPESPRGRDVRAKRAPALRRRIRAEIEAREARENEVEGQHIITW